jgi:uncharacterized protein YdeI (YjbR/CyaY-like superfamily)
MTKYEMDSEVSSSMSNNPKWNREIEELSRILIDCGLEEEWKWDKPTYTYNGHNIVIVQGFSKNCAVLFFKGMLLKDPKHVLVKAGENTRVGRQIEFTSVKEVLEMEKVLREYIKQAIEIEKSGAKIEKPNNDNMILPAELQEMFEEMPNLREAWERLTPGRQRGYLFHFNGTKNSETRTARIERNIDKILDGVGFNDQYS